MPELSQLIAGEDRSLSACTKMAATWGWCCEAGREGKDGKPSGPFFFSTRSAEGWRRQKRRVNDREKEEGHGTALCCRWAGPGAPWLLLLAGSGAPGAAFSGLQPGSPGKKASEPPPPRSYGLGAAAGGRSPPGEKVRVAVIKNKGRLACIADACVIDGHRICSGVQSIARAATVCRSETVLPSPPEVGSPPYSFLMVMVMIYCHLTSSLCNSVAGKDCPPPLKGQRTQRCFYCIVLLHEWQPTSRS